MLGAVNDGWKVAMATLGFERGTAFLGQQLGFQRELTQLIEVAHDERCRGRSVDPSTALAGLHRGPDHEVQRSAHAHGPGPQGCPRPGGEHRQAVLELVAPAARRALDGRARPGGRDHRGRDRPRATSSTSSSGCFMFSRSETIYAGASEIQRNIIGERVLGLPRGAQVSTPRGRRSNSEFRVLGRAGPAAGSRAEVLGGEEPRERGAPPDGDDRGLRPRGVVPDGERARPAEPGDPRGLRRPGLHVRRARHRPRGAGPRAAVRAVLLDGGARRRTRS